MCFSSSSLARTSSSPHTSAEEQAAVKGALPPLPCTLRRWSQLTKRRLFHQGLSIEVGAVCHQQLHQVHLRPADQAAEPKRGAPQRPAARRPSAAPAAHLAPVRRGMQWLPAVLVLGAQAGPVLQQQGRCLAEPVGGSNV